MGCSDQSSQAQEYVAYFARPCPNALILSPDACKAKGGEDRLKERVQKVLGGILQKVEAEYRSS